MLLTPAQIKPKSFESRPKKMSPGVDASHVYVGAWALGCFHSLISTKTFWRVLTKSGTAWRKVPESDAGSVGYSLCFLSYAAVTINCYCWLNAKLTPTQELHQEGKEQTPWVTLCFLSYAAVTINCYCWLNALAQNSEQKVLH